jgi:hypothetical protein
MYYCKGCEYPYLIIDKCIGHGAKNLWLRFEATQREDLMRHATTAHKWLFISIKSTKNEVLEKQLTRQEGLNY